MSSARQPGKSANSAGVQRAFGSAPDATPASGGTGAGVGAGVGATTTTGTGGADGRDGGKGCTVPHPATTSATKMKTLSDSAMRETVAMIESGMWIFLLEAVVAGCLFIGLIWWVVRGTGDRDRKRREFDEKARNDAEIAKNNIDNINKS